jgi:hypothetical protein
MQLLALPWALNDSLDEQQSKPTALLPRDYPNYPILHEIFYMR